jgi:hypothetical protein
MDFKAAEKALNNEIAFRSRNPKRRILAVDFDGTISDYNGWRGYLHAGKPVGSVVKALRKEAKNGSWIIVHTCRVTAMDGQIVPEAVEFLRSWLKKNRVPFNEIWMGTGKPYACEYWDDRAVRKP